MLLILHNCTRQMITSLGGDDIGTLKNPCHSTRALKSHALSVRLTQMNSCYALTLKLLFLMHLRFLAALVKFLHNKLSCSFCTVSF